MNLNFKKLMLMKLQANEATRGFTLIELLVVIAIIGILSGIVLTSLGTARTKARNASATSSLSSMRAEAELAFTTAYPDTICDNADGADITTNTPGSPLATLATAVTTQGATINCSASSATAPSAWAVSATLEGGSTFCVDSVGVAKVGSVVAANGVCS